MVTTVRFDQPLPKTVTFHTPQQSPPPVLTICQLCYREIVLISPYSVNSELCSVAAVMEPKTNGETADLQVQNVETAHATKLTEIADLVVFQPSNEEMTDCKRKRTGTWHGVVDELFLPFGTTIRHSFISCTTPADLEALAQERFSFVQPGTASNNEAAIRKDSNNYNSRLKTLNRITSVSCGTIFHNFDLNAIEDEEADENETFLKRAPRKFKSAITKYAKRYFHKICCEPTLFPTSTRPPCRMVLLPSIISACVAFFSLFTLWILHEKLMLRFSFENNLSFNLASYSLGSVAVVVFEAYQGPFAQPWNVLAGSFLSCVVGLTLRQFVSSLPFLAAPTAVALSIILMRVTHSTHPPAGAIAIVAAISPDIPSGPSAYLFLLFPTVIGSVWLVIWGLLLNNLVPNRQYPQYWL